MTTRRPTASDIGIEQLERIAAQGWQPLERQALGDWALRAAVGYSNRANSVQALGDPGRPLDAALAEVRRWYGERGLTPQVQLPMPLLSDLDAQLAHRGWRVTWPVLVQVAELAEMQRATTDCPDRGVDAGRVTVDRAPDAAWLAAFRYGDRSLPPAAEAMMTRADHPVFVAVRDADGVPRAIARGAVTPGWLGITAVEVAEPWRRQGLGRRVMAELATYAARQGVRQVYLQVAEGNTPARSLYDRLGFETHHTYAYRIAP